jgi:hypothetical protein
LKLLTALAALLFGLCLAHHVFAFEAPEGLPPHLTVVYQDSQSVVLYDECLGITYPQYYINYGQEIHDLIGASPSDRWQPPITATYDTCFSFVRKWHVPQNIGRLQFSDADRDGLGEVLGLLVGNAYVFERLPGETLFVQQALISPGYSMAYGGDADFDGKIEMMCSWTTGMVLREAPDSISLPIDSVFAWPWDLGGPAIMPGGFTDLDGNGDQEISFRQTLDVITVLRNIGDNQYELAYTISIPDSIMGAYYDYTSADFDGDGLSEVVSVGSEARVVCYENIAPDSFALVWSGRLSAYNSFWLTGPADLDGDSLLEFYATSEAPQGSGCLVYGFESDGQNSFRRFWEYFLPGFSWLDGEFQMIDIDGDGQKELYISSTFRIAIFKGRGGDDVIVPVYLSRAEVGYPTPGDTDGDGYGEFFIRLPYPQGMDVVEFTYGEAYRGDVNSDCLTNGLDVLYLVNYFKGREGYSLPGDIYKADLNGNCLINGVDILYLVAYLKGGAAPIDRSCP